MKILLAFQYLYQKELERIVFHVKGILVRIFAFLLNEPGFHNMLIILNSVEHQLLENEKDRKEG